MSVLFFNLNTGNGSASPGTVTRVSLSSSETGEARNVDIRLAEDYDTTRNYAARDVKPYIDSHYSAHTDAANTVTMGSSMGGLISLYALCEYPDLFGGAGCLSTHSPMKGVNLFTKRDNRLARAFRKYLSEKLPDPGNHQIYFDYGTETLDKFYDPYQKKIDAIMESKGYSQDTNWKTIRYEGDDHSERSWSRRLEVPLIFLLRNLPV